MPDNRRDLSEDLFEAIQTITNKSLEGLQYDKTILCTVTDASKANDGEYIVSDGNAEFTAYSDNTKYKEKNSVYVTIPQGNFDNKRIIIGKYQKEDSGKPYNYIAPMDNYVNITENVFIFNDENVELGVQANNKETKFLLVGTINTNLDYTGYNRLGIKADFKTLLNSFNVKTGNYGLLFKVFDSQSTEDTCSYIMQLDSSEMFGNIYNFPGFTSQEKVFDISNNLPIEKIEVYLYQKNNFYNIEGKKIPTKIDDDDDIFGNQNFLNNNIFVNNINISFGYDLSSFDNNTILLYTLNSRTYSIKYSNEENLKQLKMRWIRDIDGQLTVLDEDNDLLKIKDNQFKIHWYHWKLEQDVNDRLAGLFWEEIPEENNQSKFYRQLSPNAMVQQERIKIGIEIFPAGSEIADDELAIDYFESEVLEFDNENEAPSAATLDLIKGLTLRTSDNYNGVYAIYGENNSLMNEHDAKVKRQVIASYNSIITGNSGLDNIEEIEWKVPATNTMIQVIGDAWNLTSDEKYYISNEQLQVQEAEAGAEIETELYMTYTIAPVYSQLDTNNTIICTISKNGLKYTAELSMSFAISGTNGTDYTLIIEIDDPEGKNAIVLDEIENNSLQIKVGVQDYSHQIVKNVQYTASFLTNKSLEEINFNIEEETRENDFKYFKIIRKNTNNKEPEVLIFSIKASISNNIILEGYLPIPQVSDASLVKYSLEGPTKIIYSEAGQNPSYTKKSYKLYDEDGNPKEVLAILPQNKNGWPILSRNFLQPAPIFYINKNDFPYVKIHINEEKYWIQPILIIVNRFGSSMLNKWDGELQIDKDNNRILASTIAAGKKETNNSFSGLLMGEVGKVNGDNNNDIGLMGYDKGQRTFFLNSKNGETILGASGKGQITLNGETGIIKSGEYDISNGKSGMKIDLSTGAIDAFNFKLTSQNIILDSTNDNRNLLIKKDDNTSLMEIGNNNFFLQSANFNNQNSSGFKLDLNNGRILGYNSKLQFKYRPNDNNALKVIFIGKDKDNANLLAKKRDIYNEKDWYYDNDNDDHNSDQKGITWGYLNDGAYEIDSSIFLRSGKLATAYLIDTSTNRFWAKDENNYAKIKKENESIEVEEGITWDWIENCTVIKLNDINQILTIDSSHDTTPFSVMSNNKETFSIDWDGGTRISYGTIGGWDIDDNKLTSKTGTIGMAKWSGNDNPIFWSGGKAYNNSNWKKDVGFGVSGDGQLIANKGLIGNWQIKDGFLQGYSQSGATLTLKPDRIELGKVKEVKGYNDDGSPILGNTTVNAKIDVNGTIIASSFTGYLNGSAYNSQKFGGHDISYFATANHTHPSSTVAFYAPRTPGGTPERIVALAGVGSGSGGATCFIKGTKILMGNYSYKNIEDINIGDKVLSYDIKTKNFIAQEVYGISEHHTDIQLLHITFEDNSYLNVTSSHPLLSNEGWKSQDLRKAFIYHQVQTSYLTLSDQLLTPYGKLQIKNISIIRTNKSNAFYTYNISVKNTHTYIANNIIVHNAIQDLKF